MPYFNFSKEFKGFVHGSGRDSNSGSYCWHSVGRCLLLTAQQRSRDAGARASKSSQRCKSRLRVDRKVDEVGSESGSSASATQLASAYTDDTEEASKCCSEATHTYSSKADQFQRSSDQHPQGQHHSFETCRSIKCNSFKRES